MKLSDIRKNPRIVADGPPQICTKCGTSYRFSRQDKLFVALYDVCMNCADAETVENMAIPVFMMIKDLETEDEKEDNMKK